MVDRADFGSYYGRPIIKAPVWEARDIAGYLFTGGLAGASSTIAAFAEATGRPDLARGLKVTSAGAASVSIVALVHDLGRPARFVNMLRVFKPSSPMSVGSWLLAGFVPASLAAAGTAVTGRYAPVGRVATVTAGALGPAVATYTAALISDTAVPAWHDPHPVMPAVFAASAAMAASGAGLMVASPGEQTPVRRLAVVSAAAETLTTRRLRSSAGRASTAYEQGRAGTLAKAAEALTAVGVVGALLAERDRRLAVAGGAALVASSACRRFSIFHAGVASAEDPSQVVAPQRQRLASVGSVL